MRLKQRLARCRARSPAYVRGMSQRQTAANSHAAVTTRPTPRSRACRASEACGGAVNTSTVLGDGAGLASGFCVALRVAGFFKAMLLEHQQRQAVLHALSVVWLVADVGDTWVYTCWAISLIQ